MPGLVGHAVRQAILARLGGLDLNLGQAFVVGVELPGSDFGLDRLALLLVVGDLQQPQLAVAFDRLAVEPAGGEAGVDRVADAVVAAVDPGEDLERLAGDEHVARADDRAARLIDDFGRDRVAVVLVGVQLLGERRVDLDFDRAVGADRHFALGDDFRRRRLAPAPPRRRPHGSPTRASRDTRRSRTRTTSSRGRRTSPTAPGGYQRARVLAAQHLVLHLGVR